MSVWKDLRDGLATLATDTVDPALWKVVSQERPISTWVDFLETLATDTDDDGVHDHLKAVIITQSQPFRVRDVRAIGGAYDHTYTFEVLILSGSIDEDGPGDHDDDLDDAMEVADAIEVRLDIETAGTSKWGSVELMESNIEVRRAEMGTYGPIGAWLVELRVQLTTPQSLTLL